MGYRVRFQNQIRCFSLNVHQSDFCAVRCYGHYVDHCNFESEFHICRNLFTSCLYFVKMIGYASLQNSALNKNLFYTVSGF